MLERYYYFPCPLCQHDVDVSQPDYFRVLPVDSEQMAVFHEKPAVDEYDWITIGNFLISWRLSYPQLEYIHRVWCIHTRCIGFVDHLPLPKLYLLLDLIEATFLSCTSSPRSRYGGFYAQSVQQEDPVPAPLPTALSAARLFKGSWNVMRAIFCCAAPKKKNVDTSLPPEIWDMIFQHDVDRLLLVARTASQLTRLESQSKIPSTRFTVGVVDLPSSMVQIHLISLGGRTYISNLSDSVVNCATQSFNIKYDLRGKSYLAIKSDGIGVVDIAFEQEGNCGPPKWILHNKEPFTRELSRIKLANLQRLRIVKDVCAALVPILF